MLLIEIKSKTSNLFENNFDTLKANKAVIKGDANLKVRVEILRNRFNDFIDSLD